MGKLPVSTDGHGRGFAGEALGVFMKGYTGPDHVGTIEAIRKIAEARYPERWAKDAISQEELGIWDALGTSLASELWEQHLLILVRERDPMMAHRIADYREAATELRDALVAEELLAQITEDDGSLQKILGQGWRGPDAALVLYRGTAWLDEGETTVCRLVLLPRTGFQSFLAGLAIAARAVPAAPNKTRSGRPPKHDPAYVRSIVFRLMDINGDFNVAVEIWNAQARLEEAVREELGSDLAEGRLRAAITPHLAEWRASKARNAGA